MQESDEIYADVLKENGYFLEKYVGFIDGTKIRITRPGGHGWLKRAAYSGYKRMNCLVYQSMSTPDRPIVSLGGPVEGRRHDMTLFQRSNWEEVMEQYFLIDRVQFLIYGDYAYLVRPWM